MKPFTRTYTYTSTHTPTRTQRNFCVKLNATFAKKLPVDLPPFTGNHADLLYIVIHQLMTDGPTKLDTLYDCFLTTMSNVRRRVKLSMNTRENAY